MTNFSLSCMTKHLRLSLLLRTGITVRELPQAAQLLNQRAFVYMPKNTSKSRVEAIESLGGEVTVTDLNYDDTVRYASNIAHKNNWPVMQDTSWEGYEDIPLKYAGLFSNYFQEIKAHLKDDFNELIMSFCRRIVGSFAGSAASLIQSMDHKNIKIIIVEPDNATCLYKSAEHVSGDTQNVGGDLQTMMAGLSCGEPSTQGWSILKDDKAFIHCSDISAKGMKMPQSIRLARAEYYIRRIWQRDYRNFT